VLSDTQLEYTVKTGEVDSHILPSLAAHHQDSVDVHGPSVVCLPLGIVEPDIAPWCASHAATGEELRPITGHPGVRTVLWIQSLLLLEAKLMSMCLPYFLSTRLRRVLVAVSR